MSNPSCGHTEAEKVFETRTFKRDGRAINYLRAVWSCPVCVNPETGIAPFRYMDGGLAAENTTAIEETWQQIYKEPLPPSPLPVRRSPSIVVPLPLAPADLSWIDSQRGERSREMFLQELIGERRRAS